MSYSLVSWSELPYLLKRKIGSEEAKGSKVLRTRKVKQNYRSNSGMTEEICIIISVVIIVTMTLQIKMLRSYRCT
jgi:hypothetical protein